MDYFNLTLTQVWIWALSVNQDGLQNGRSLKVFNCGHSNLVIYHRIYSKFHTYYFYHAYTGPLERSGSVVECLTWDRGAGGSSLTGVTALWSKNINPSLVLVQPRKTHPFITERLLIGRKESNQTNKYTAAPTWNMGSVRWRKTKMAAKIAVYDQFALVETLS